MYTRAEGLATVFALIVLLTVESLMLGEPGHRAGRPSRSPYTRRASLPKSRAMDHEARAPSEGLPAVFTFMRFSQCGFSDAGSKLIAPTEGLYILYIDKASPV